MTFKRLILLVSLAFLAPAGCGKHAGSGGPDDIKGLPVASSAYAGMVLATTAVDQTIGTSTIYYYDFATGVVHQLLDGQSADPALFWVDGRAFLFNRTGERNLRIFDPRQTTPLPEPLPLAGLTAGDPWDIAPLTTGRTVALAEPLGMALEVLDYVSGQITPVAKPALASALRPHALMRSGDRLWLLHGGVDVNGKADGSQQVYGLNVQADGTPAFVDQVPSTPAVDGLKLVPSNPVGFVDPDGQGGATIVGLCLKEWVQCTAGAGRLAAGAGVSALPAQSLAGLYYFGKVVDGPTDTAVYAHVRTASDQYKVMRLDLAGAAASEVGAVPDARLVALAYDRSAQALFVGGAADVYGTLTLYHADQAAGSFQLNGVPYASVFVPK